MAKTYVPIATQTLGSAAASVTFSSIPATYTDLVLVIDAIGTGTGGGKLNFNSDSSALYSRTILHGNGTAAGSTRDTASTTCFISHLASVTSANRTNFVVHIMNYANTTTYKTSITRANNPAEATETTVGLYRSTNAISSIVIALSANSYDTGSTFSLYGILAA